MGFSNGTGDIYIYIFPGTVRRWSSLDNSIIYVYLRFGQILFNFLSKDYQPVIDVIPKSEAPPYLVTKPIDPFFCICVFFFFVFVSVYFWIPFCRFCWPKLPQTYFAWITSFRWQLFSKTAFYKLCMYRNSPNFNGLASEEVRGYIPGYHQHKSIYLVYTFIFIYMYIYHVCVMEFGQVRDIA